MCKSVGHSLEMEWVLDCCGWYAHKQKDREQGKINESVVI